MGDFMKTYKGEIAYSIILFFSIFLIYHTFHVAFEEVILSHEQDKTNIFLLSLGQYIYLTVGLLLVAFTVYLYMNLTAYMAGKLFFYYLTCISIAVCLLVTTNNQNSVVNILIVILVFFSNIVLYYSIGYLTLIAKKNFCIFMARILIIITLILILLYLVSANTTVFSIKTRNLIITTDYFITMILILLSMLHGYKESNVYSKKQIKFLSSGFIMGIIVFILLQFIPMIAVVKVPDSMGDSYEIDKTVETDGKEDLYSIIHMENLEGHHNIYQIMIFSGTVITMIYLLIKREYLGINNKGLKRYLLSVVYLILANTYFFIILSENTLEFILFNLLLILPLLSYSYQISKNKDTIYGNCTLELIEEEREKLSIFLHDEILQDLIALSHSIRPEEAKQRLTSIIGLIRTKGQDIYPTIVEDLGVEQALKIFIEEVEIDHNIELIFRYEYPKGVLPKKVSLIIYRTVKELITNAIKHARCTQITIGISKGAEGIVCVVSDNGIGFQVPENEKLLKNSNIGLYTIRKQIANLSGNMRISSDKEGSEFQFYIPLR
ncbi:hypothetical protein F7O84_01130 [Candidatus Galacturonibacter soehngenii]|uniref:histidine kinase n=2 Tax=Candidatus Galacturonatibacter soehngenii TaxID=2307010 RepID=A0A7V7QN97_9FIRM|nr:hypothetical protein F7O84_01130 [Candidatus Galacturonibacter soehngenii]